MLSSTSAQSLAAVRWLHREVTLLDGRVLVVGGRPGVATSTSEIFDPKEGTWKLTAPMLFGHDWPIAARMCDGRVFVAVGGGPGGQQAESSSAADSVAPPFTHSSTTQSGVMGTSASDVHRRMALGTRWAW